MKVIDASFVLVVNVEHQINFHLYSVMKVLFDDDDHHHHYPHHQKEFLLRETIYPMVIECLPLIE